MGKRVLLVDGGGRGTALAQKIYQSPHLERLFVAPGNAGTSEIANNIPIEATDVEGLLEFALRAKIDLTVVGQDESLALGIVDTFQAKKLRTFGPTKAAAEIEWSKVFSKRLMSRCGVLTAPYTVLHEPHSAFPWLQERFNSGGKAAVLKPDGLAFGKGAYICKTYAKAEQAIIKLMVNRIHGKAGEYVVAEDFVDGQEVSIHSFCDGHSFSLFPAAQDHKQIFDGDRGPMTGGMGAIAPVPWFDDQAFVSNEIVSPILTALRVRGRPFSGCLFPGLKGRHVLEFNARFGDPETQVYMQLLKTDILEILEACVDGRLHEIKIEWNPGFAACIVLTSAGYPSPNYKKGVPITGIEDAESLSDVVVFHAGTKYVDGQLVTSGGRVLGVTAVGQTLQEAVDRAYMAVSFISFEGMHYRRDIGTKALMTPTR